MLYISVLLLLFILSYNYDYRNVKRGRLTWYIITLIIFILIAGLRYRLGVDAIRYENGYLELPTLSELRDFDFDSTRFAPGYVVFHAIARSISDEWVAMQFLQAIYVNCIIFWFFYRYSRKIFFCIIIYALSLYFNFMCEVMREACAAATLLLAWPYFIQKKWIHYYALSIISILFHTSAFITLVLPILYLPKIRNVFMIGKHTILLLLGVFAIGTIIGYALTDYLKVFYFIDGMEKNVDNYADGDLAKQTLNIIGIVDILIRWSGIYPFLAIIYLKRHVNSKKGHITEDPLNFMVGLSLIVTVLSIPIPICYRYNDYFYPFAIVAIGNWVYTTRPFVNIKLKTNFKYNAWLLIFLPFFFLTTYRYFMIDKIDIPEEARYYPYASIFDKSVDPTRTQVQHYHHAY